MTYAQDIMRAAEAALDKLLCNCAESCGGYAGVRAASINDIAEAIAAERERCAEIVSGHQVAFASDACGWALDKIKDGLPATAVRVAKR